MCACLRYDGIRGQTSGQTRRESFVGVRGILWKFSLTCWVDEVAWPLGDFFGETVCVEFAGAGGGGGGISTTRLMRFQTLFGRALVCRRADRTTSDALETDTMAMMVVVTRYNGFLTYNEILGPRALKKNEIPDHQLRLANTTAALVCRSKYGRFLGQNIIVNVRKIAIFGN